MNTTDTLARGNATELKDEKDKQGDGADGVNQAKKKDKQCERVKKEEKMNERVPPDVQNVESADGLQIPQTPCAPVRVQDLE